MTVLIVDDQINVVEGIVNGVDFARAGMDTVLTAYSAAGARELLLMYPVDVILCDIEMPGENGLSLYRWAKDKHMELECIFLTAHADFSYAKTAMQLESMDYILQPAPYEEVSNALLKARRRLEERREHKKFYSYGKLLFDERKTIVDQKVRDWYGDCQNVEKYQGMKESMQKMGIHIFDHTQVLLALQESFWDGEPWKKDLFRYSCENILGEMLEPWKAGVYLWELDQNLFLVFITLPAGTEQDEKKLDGILAQYHGVASDFFGCKIALYVSSVCLGLKAKDKLSCLSKSHENNVDKRSGIFYSEKADLTEQAARLPDFKVWESYMVSGLGKVVYDEICEYFACQSQEGHMNAVLLKRFYNEFYKSLSLVEERTGTDHEDLFPGPEDLEVSLHAYENLESMKKFLRTVTAYFNREMELSGRTENRIHQIKDYVYRHLDTEIRREDIAAALFLNPNYLSRLFKNETGMSLKEFIIQEKMKMARGMLKGSWLPVSIVAQKVGYVNFSHFSQVYKKTFGVSPTDERGNL